MQHTLAEKRTLVENLHAECGLRTGLPLDETGGGTAGGTAGRAGEGGSAERTRTLKRKAEAPVNAADEIFGMLTNTDSQRTAPPPPVRGEGNARKGWGGGCVL